MDPRLSTSGTGAVFGAGACAVIGDCPASDNGAERRREPPRRRSTHADPSGGTRESSAAKGLVGDSQLVSWAGGGAG